MPEEYPKYFVGTQVDGLLGRAEQLFVRGENLNDLLGKATFTDALFHILLGRLPTAKQRNLFDLVLVAFHGGFGLMPPTTLVPRLVAGTGVPVAQALAAGYLASGPYHVGAVEEAMRLYNKIYTAFKGRQPAPGDTPANLEDFAAGWAAEMIGRKETIPGYGHPLFRTDPRPTRIRRVLCDLQAEGPFIDIYDGVVRATATHKALSPNVDGITAAILLTLGCKAEHGTGLFLLARTAAMLAHVVEEQTVMPYQTQKRFMLLPIAAPRLFNANFQRLSKFFNRLRDNPSYQRLLTLFGGNPKKPFIAREAEDLQVIAKAKTLAPPPPIEQPHESPPPCSPEQLISDEDAAQVAHWMPEPLACAAMCLATSLHQLQSAATQQQRIAEPISQAMSLVCRAAEAAKEQAGQAAQ